MFFCWGRPAGKESGLGGRPERVRRKWDGPAGWWDGPTGHTCRSSGKQSGPGGRPGVSGLAARRPAWFALDSPQALCFRFPGANLGPGFSRLAARRPAWFALTSPQALCFRFPGANLGPGFSGLEVRRPAWFALTSPQALCFRFPGANLGPGISGFEARRPGVSRRGLLPPLREPLKFRSGEQILHTNSAPQAGAGRFSKARFAPPLREPLQLRPGEQILHTNSAPTPSAGRLFQGAVCSPLSASPCGSVPGSKFFTQFPRRHRGPAAFSMARFAPRSPRALAVPFRGANSSHNFRAFAQCRQAFPRRGLLPALR